MALFSMTDLLDDAVANRYAVCYWESWNLESFMAVLEAAEELDTPIIAGSNGGFLGHPARSKPKDIAYYAGLGLALRRSTARAAFLLNETDDLTQIERGLDLGFNAVMVDNERLQKSAYVALVKKVVELARRAGAAVEAATGVLADGAGHIKAEVTSPPRPGRLWKRPAWKPWASRWEMFTSSPRAKPRSIWKDSKQFAME